MGASCVDAKHPGGGWRSSGGSGGALLPSLAALQACPSPAQHAAVISGGAPGLPRHTGGPHTLTPSMALACRSFRSLASLTSAEVDIWCSILRLAEQEAGRQLGRGRAEGRGGLRTCGQLLNDEGGQDDGGRWRAGRVFHLGNDDLAGLGPSCCEPSKRQQRIAPAVRDSSRSCCTLPFLLQQPQ